MAELRGGSTAGSNSIFTTGSASVRANSLSVSSPFSFDSGAAIIKDSVGAYYLGNLASYTIPITYAIAVNTASINEGGTSKSFTVTTTNVPDGTVLYWSTDTSVGTISAADFTDNTLTGTVTINSNSGTIIRSAAADSLTEGTEAFILRLRTDSISGTIVASSSGTDINDTSVSAGDNAGFSSAGNPLINVIDKFPFASDGNATDVGDLSVLRRGVGGQSSTVNGYTSGGIAPSLSPTTADVIDKFPFASGGTGTDVGNLTVARYFMAGQSSGVSGYSSGGSNLIGPTYTSDVIDKFPFASNANATDVGNLTVIRGSVAGQSSSVSGYTSGGTTAAPGPVNTNTIDKFPFASNANATDVGDLLDTIRVGIGQSSDVSGYTSGGAIINPAVTPAVVNINIIQKFPFASDTNATDVGDLTVARQFGSGQFSNINGYTCGGTSPVTLVAVIDKFPFASNTNATNVGNLSRASNQTAGQQY